MILGYKKRFPWGSETNFKRKILEDIKKHSLRTDRKNRWITGRKIQHAHGVRTKQYDHFQNGECKSVQHIVIEELTVDTLEPDHFYIYDYQINGKPDIKGFRILVDDRVLSWEEIITLSRNDGFDTVQDFFRWFFDGFNGKIIHFTDLKY